MYMYVVRCELQAIDIPFTSMTIHYNSVTIKGIINQVYKSHNNNKGTATPRLVLGFNRSSSRLKLPYI